MRRQRTDALTQSPSSCAGLVAALADSWRPDPPPLRLTLPDLSEVAPVLINSGAGALGWWRVRHSELRTTPAAQELREAYRRDTILGALHERHIQGVIAALRAEGITSILVKGWAVARLYPDPGLRVSGDIDLLVRPPDLARAQRALASRPDLSPQVDTWHEELDRFTDADWDGVFARAQTVRLGDTDLQVLAPEDHLAFLCVHFLRHGAWRPIWLCDIAAALESRPPDFDWNLCLHGPWGRADWIACALALAGRLLGAELSGTPVADRAEQLPRWLVPQVLRQWERPSPRQHGPPPLIREALRRPSALPSALRARWRGPIEATVRTNGPFNRLPRLPFQLADYAMHLVRFVRGESGPGAG